MRLTKCESNQLIEATRMWFNKNGGNVDVKIKKVEVSHQHDNVTFIRPLNFSKVEKKIKKVRLD